MNACLKLHFPITVTESLIWNSSELEKLNMFPLADFISSTIFKYTIVVKLSAWMYYSLYLNFVNILTCSELTSWHGNLFLKCEMAAYTPYFQSVYITGVWTRDLSISSPVYHKAMPTSPHQLKRSNIITNSNQNRGEG